MQRDFRGSTPPVCQISSWHLKPPSMRDWVLESSTPPSAQSSKYFIHIYNFVPFYMFFSPLKCPSLFSACQTPTHSIEMSLPLWRFACLPPNLPPFSLSPYVLYAQLCWICPLKLSMSLVLFCLCTQLLLPGIWMPRYLYLMNTCSSFKTCITHLRPHLPLSGTISCCPLHAPRK